MGGSVTLPCSAAGRWGKQEALFMVEVGALEVEGELKTLSVKH